MNIYARIRKIEDPIEFKRLVDTVLASEYGTDYQAVKEWRDFGVDGYQKNDQTVYAFYCPKYPERKELKQYREKVVTDITKLKKAIDEKQLKLKVKEWIFVTPDDLPVEIIDLIGNQSKQYKWKSGALTAQTLAPLFMKHQGIQPDFPGITAGLQLDVRLAENRSYKMLELFNDGTEDIRNIDVKISDDNENWRVMTDYFIYEFEDPIHGHGHSMFNLKKGERQYCNRVPNQGGFYFKISGVGVESNKTFIKESFIEKINAN